MRQLVARPIKLAETSSIFTSGYTSKSRERQKAVDKAVRLLQQDLYYPSLRARKMGGGAGIWEAHASDTVVMTFDFIDKDSVRLRVCCNHDIYRRP